MKKYIGTLLGIFAGILFVIPMIIQNFPWSENTSAFLMWIVTGFLISTSNLKVSPALKGLIISVLVLIPIGPVFSWNNPVVFFTLALPTTMALGLFLGWAIDKFNGKYEK